MLFWTFVVLAGLEFAGLVFLLWVIARQQTILNSVMLDATGRLDKLDEAVEVGLISYNQQLSALTWTIAVATGNAPKPQSNVEELVEHLLERAKKYEKTQPLVYEALISEVKRVASTIKAR